MAYFHSLRRQFPQFVNPKAPFFLTPHGTGVEETDVHTAVKHIFDLTTTSSGPAANKIGQHCMRVSGAQLLARAGSDVQLIKLFGRWGSSSVERYIQEAPLARSEHIARAVLQHLHQPLRLLHPAAMQPHIFAALEDEPHSGALSDAVAPFLQQTQPAEATEPPTELPAEEQAQHDLILIRNTKSGMLHRRLIDELNSSNILRRGRCGWTYGRRSFERVPRTFQGPKCPKCFRPNTAPEEASAPPNPQSPQADAEVDSSSAQSDGESADSSSSRYKGSPALCCGSFRGMLRPITLGELPPSRTHIG